MGEEMGEEMESIPSQSSTELACFCEGKLSMFHRTVEREALPDYPGHFYRAKEWCSCEKAQTFKAKQDEEERQRQLRLSEVRREEVVEKCRIPSRFYHFTIEESPLASTKPDLVRELVESAGWGFDGGSWYFHGLYGTGKTGLAVGYLRQAMGLHDRESYPSHGQFWSTADLFTALRATYNAEGENEASIIESISEVEFLVLDDIGVEKPSEWVQDRLYQVISRRHAEEMPTIFTSNLSPSGLAKRIGARSMWRILEMCGKSHIVRVEGPNLRVVPSDAVGDAPTDVTRANMKSAEI